MGSTLEAVDDPDETQVLKIDCGTLSTGDYIEVDFVTRQVFDLDISRWVTEYQAEISICQATGKQIVAPFPVHVTKKRCKCGLPVPHRFGET